MSLENIFQYIYTCLKMNLVKVIMKLVDDITKH